jgi:hypothetical protein
MMRISESYYGDFIVTDELPWNVRSLDLAAAKISREVGVQVREWPLTIDFNEKTEMWEAWFGKPVSDEQYASIVPLAEEE